MIQLRPSHTHMHKMNNKRFESYFCTQRDVASALVTITSNCQCFNGEKLQLKHTERERGRSILTQWLSTSSLTHTHTHTHIHTDTLYCACTLQFLCPTLFLFISLKGLGFGFVRIALKASQSTRNRCIIISVSVGATHYCKER